HEAVIRKLNERERIQLATERTHPDAAPESGWAKTGAHITERWRRGNRLCLADSDVGRLVAIERDTITAEQPCSKRRLALAAQFKVKVPNLFDLAHRVERLALESDRPGELTR